jgi:hypothetical protein
MEPDCLLCSPWSVHHSGYHLTSIRRCSVKLKWFVNSPMTPFLVSVASVLLVAGAFLATADLDDLVSISAMMKIAPPMACAFFIPLFSAVGLFVSRPRMTFRLGATLCGMLLVGTLLGTATNSTLFYSERLASLGVAPRTRGALAAGIGGIVFSIACFAFSRCVFGKSRQRPHIYIIVVLLSAVLGGAITSIGATTDDLSFFIWLALQQLAPALLSAALVINQLTLQSDKSSEARIVTGS